MKHGLNQLCSFICVLEHRFTFANIFFYLSINLYFYFNREFSSLLEIKLLIYDPNLIFSYFSFDKSVRLSNKLLQ